MRPVENAWLCLADRQTIRRCLLTGSTSALLLCLFLTLQAGTYGQGRRSRRPPSVHPSVVLIPSPPGGEESPATKALIEQQQARLSRRRRKAPAGSGRMAVRKRAGATVHVTAGDVRALAYSLFMEALSDRLQNSRWQVPLSGSSGKPAGPAQPLPHPTIVVATHLVEVKVREGSDREVSERFEIEIPALPYSGLPQPPRRFQVIGVAVAGHLLVKPQYSTPLPDQIREAAVRAAALAVHALRTGEVSPLEQVGARIAVVPVSAPEAADALVFSSTGRAVEPKAVRGLPADVSDRFHPDVRPLGGDSVVAGDALRRAMTAGSPLWESNGAPAIGAVQELGRRLGVGYVLLCHIADVEFEVGPPEPSSLLSTLDPTEPRPGTGPVQTRLAASVDPAAAWRLRVGSAGVIERDARAESVGVLVRISDGAILWSKRAEETMSIRSTDPPRIAHETDPRICMDAEQFSLLQLERLFKAYRASFQN